MNISFRAASFLRATALALPFALASCNDAADRPATSAFEPIQVEGVSDALIASHFTVEPTTVSASDARTALERLNLDEPGEALRWATRESEADGTYIFTDVEMLDANGETIGTIARIDLAGLRPEGERGVAADRLQLSEMRLTDEDEGAVFTLDTLTLIETELDDLADIGPSGTTIEDLGVPDARAASAEGFGIAVDSTVVRGTIALDSLAFAKPRDPEDPDGFFKMGALEVDMANLEEGTEVPFRISFEGATASDLRTIVTSGRDLAAVGGSAFSPYDPLFGSLDIGRLEARLDAIDIVSEGLQVATERDGDGRLLTRNSIGPIRLGFESESSTPEFSSFQESLEELGYDTIELTGRGESVADPEADTIRSVEGGFFEMKDGFRIESDYEIRGLAAAQAAQREALREAGFGADTDLGDLSDERSQAYGQAVREAQGAMLDAFEIAGLTLRIQDLSLTDRVFELLAERGGTTPRKLRMQAKGGLALAVGFGPNSGIDEGIVTQMVEALGAFIDTPGSTLSITLDPAEPVGLDTINGSTAEELGFSATTVPGN